MISHGVKLSQKQRKMIAMTTKDNNSGMNSVETALTAPSKTSKPANAWYALMFIKISIYLYISFKIFLGFGIFFLSYLSNYFILFASQLKIGIWEIKTLFLFF